MRPANVEELIGDEAKARRVLGWVPEVGFDELVQMMVNIDVREQRALAGLCADGCCAHYWHHRP